MRDSNSVGFGLLNLKIDIIVSCIVASTEFGYPNLLVRGNPLRPKKKETE